LAILKTAANQSLTATASSVNALTASQMDTLALHAAVPILVVAGFASPTTAGVAGTFTVTAKDPYSNTATSYTGTVHFTSSDAEAVVRAHDRTTGTDSGRHTSAATMKTAGSQSLSATDTVTS